MSIFSLHLRFQKSSCNCSMVVKVSFLENYLVHLHSFLNFVLANLSNLKNVWILYTYIWLIAFFRFWTPGFVALWRWWTSGHAVLTFFELFTRLKKIKLWIKCWVLMVNVLNISLQGENVWKFEICFSWIIFRFSIWSLNMMNIKYFFHQ